MKQFYFIDDMIINYYWRNIKITLIYYWLENEILIGPRIEHRNQQQHRPMISCEFKKQIGYCIAHVQK